MRRNITKAYTRYIVVAKPETIAAWQLQEYEIKTKQELLYSAHIHPKLLTAQGVCIQMYRGWPLPRIEPGSPACQPAALTTRPNSRHRGMINDTTKAFVN
jgi:hypothetical protein